MGTNIPERLGSHFSYSSWAILDPLVAFGRFVKTRWNIVYESASIVHFKNRIELLEELKVGIFWFP